ncbi:MAG: acyltransferase [Parvibaculum sp.]
MPWDDLVVGDHQLAARLFYAVARFGQEAVLVFFVLSGFFVGGQVIARLEAGRFRLGDYAIDRATRLFLPLIPACALTAFVGFSLTGNLANLPALLGSAFGLNGVFVDTSLFNPPLWSIAFEIWFYVAAGAVACIFSGRARAAALIAFIAIGYVFSILNASFLLFWVIGAFIYKCRDELNKPVYFCFGLALAMVAAAHFETYQAGPDVMARDRAIHWQALVCVGFGLMIPYLGSGGVNRMLQPFAKVASFMAASSYSLYVFHYPVLKAMTLFIPQIESFGVGPVVAFVAISVASFAACLGFWGLFERHTDVVRRKLKARSAAASGRPVLFLSMLWRRKQPDLDAI